MIKRSKLLNDLEQNQHKKEETGFSKNFKLWLEMYKEAVYLKIIPLKNPLDGIEKDIRIARVINSV